MSLPPRGALQQTKPPSVTPSLKGGLKSGEKVSPVPTKTTSGHVRPTSIRPQVTPSERASSARNVSKSSESKTKPWATASSRRSSLNTNPEINTSTSSNSARRSSLQSQNQVRSRINTGLTKDRAKTLVKPSIDTKISETVGQSSTRQIQPKDTNIQSQREDSIKTEGPKRSTNDESRLKNPQTSMHIQIQNKSQVGTGRQTAGSSTRQVNRKFVAANKLSIQSRPRSSSSVKNETQGRIPKDSVDQLPQRTENNQTLDKEDLLLTPNRSNETPSIAITSPKSDSTEILVEGSSHAECYEETFESSVADAAPEYSTEERRVSHMECQSPMSITPPTNDGETIGSLDNVNKSLSLKGIGNEKFSCDEVKNSSMISEKDNEDPLRVSEMSTIIFDGKTLLEEQRNKEFFEFYRKEENVMKSLYKIKYTNFKTLQKAERSIMDTMFLVHQEPPEIFSQVQQGAILLCSEMERETKKFISMVKEKVEELKNLMNKSRIEELQASKSGEIVSLQENSRVNDYPDDIYTESNAKPQEDKDERDIILTVVDVHEDSPNKYNSLIHSLIEKFIHLPDSKPNLLASMQDIVKDEQKYQKWKREIEESKKSLGESKKFAEGDGEIEESQEISLGVEGSKTLVKGKVEVEMPEISEPHFEENPIKLSQKNLVEIHQLPKDENVDLTFLGNIKSISPSKEEVMETFQDEDVKRAIELSLQKDERVVEGIQDEGVERALEDNKRVLERIPSQNKNEFVEISILPDGKITSRRLHMQNESDIQPPLQNKRSSINMSYLPKDDTIEMKFLNSIKETFRKIPENKEDDIEESLQDESTVEKIENSRVIEPPIQNEEETVESSSLQNVKKVQMSSLNEKDFEINVLENKTVAKNLSNKQQIGLEDKGNLQKEGDVVVEKKALHQQSVRKKEIRTQEAIDVPSYSNKEETLEISKNKDSSTELKYPENQEISELITPKSEQFYITDKEMLKEALEALIAERID